MPTGAAGVFAEGAADIDERDPVAEQHARQRVTDDVPPLRLVHERVAAVTRVLRAAVPFSDGMHVMAEQSAEIPNLLFEDAAPRVWVAVTLEKKRVTAADAGVLGMPVPLHDPFIGMVAEEARQGMADADDLLIVRE